MMSFSMSRVYEWMEHAQKVTLPQQPLATSIPLSEETLPEPPTKIDIKDLPKRFVPVHMYLHACILYPINDMTLYRVCY